MSYNNENDTTQVDAFINREYEWLDNLQALDDRKYLDVKYLAICSALERLGNRIYRDREYELCSIIELENTENAKDYTIYISPEGDYCVKDPKGAMRHDKLPEDLQIYNLNLTDKPHYNICKSRILAITSKKGHTQKKLGTRENFIKLLTEYYEGDEFKYISSYIVKQITALIGNDHKNPYLIEVAENYYNKLIKKIHIFEKAKEILLNSVDKLTEIDLMKRIENENGYDSNEILEYLKLLTLASYLYYFGRCSLTHEGPSIIIDYYYEIPGQKGQLLRERLETGITYNLIDAAIRNILEKWKNQLIAGKYTTLNFPGANNI